MFFWLIFLICAIGIILFFASGSEGPKKGKRRMVAVAILLLPLVMLAFVKITKGFIPMPTIRHILHLTFPPEDLYEPIVVDEFKFHEKGFEKRYVLKPKYLGGYMIGFVSGKQNIPQKETFKGKIKVEFFWKDTFLFEKTVTSQRAAVDADNDKTMKYYKKVILVSFEVPLQGKYKDDISVRLTVLEADENLKKYGNSIKLFIGVSPIP